GTCNARGARAARQGREEALLRGLSPLETHPQGAQWRALARGFRWVRAYGCLLPTCSAHAWRRRGGRTWDRTLALRGLLSLLYRVFFASHVLLVCGSPA